MRADYGALLDAGCQVLSPTDIDWVAELDGFVLAASELEDDPGDIEQSHLRAMRSADFVWLHASEGYVGRSAAMELGYAHALGLPVFARELPSDIALARLVCKVDSPTSAMASLRMETRVPALGLDSLQRYYRRAAETRGWADEGAQECLCLLAEELGELMGAVRKEGADSHAAALEMADVQLYLAHLANIADIDLGAAVVEKERINAARFGPPIGRAAA